MKKQIFLDFKRKSNGVLSILLGACGFLVVMFGAGHIITHFEPNVSYVPVMDMMFYVSVVGILIYSFIEDFPRLNTSPLVRRMYLHITNDKGMLHNEKVKMIACWGIVAGSVMTWYMLSELNLHEYQSHIELLAIAAFVFVLISDRIKMFYLKRVVSRIEESCEEHGLEQKLNYFKEESNVDVIYLDHRENDAITGRLRILGKDTSKTRAQENLEEFILKFIHLGAEGIKNRFKSYFQSIDADNGLEFRSVIDGDYDDVYSEKTLYGYLFETNLDGEIEEDHAQSLYSIVYWYVLEYQKLKKVLIY